MSTVTMFIAISEANIVRPIVLQQGAEFGNGNTVPVFYAGA